MKNRLSQYGLLIIGLASVIATVLFYLLNSDSIASFLKTDSFRIIIMPLITCGLVFIAVGENKQNLKIRPSIKLLLTLLFVVWIILSILTIQTQF